MQDQKGNDSKTQNTAWFYLHSVRVSALHFHLFFIPVFNANSAFSSAMTQSWQTTFADISRGLISFIYSPNMLNAPSK